MNRGDVYDARLDPTEGSEQAGSRPVIIVSRDAINTNLNIVIVVPCTSHRPTTRMHPGRVLLRLGYVEGIVLKSGTALI